MHFHEKVIGKDSKQKLLQDCNNYLCKAYKDVFHLSFVEKFSEDFPDHFENHKLSSYLSNSRSPTDNNKDLKILKPAPPGILSFDLQTK